MNFGPRCVCALVLFCTVVLLSMSSVAESARVHDDAAAAGAVAPQKPDASVNDEELVRLIAEDLKGRAERDEFSGVVLVARDGKALYSHAFGMASKSYEVPNREDTQFNLASVGKMFTAVAILQLAEAGKLSLDDPASKYVPEEWLAQEYGSKITIKHLLTHTSGFGTYFEKLNKQSEVFFFRDLGHYKKLIRSETPTFDPGTKWSYSNTGMVLLGVIVERVSGQEYFEYLNEHILKPAGMTKTVALDKDSAVAGRATGYMKLNVSGKAVWRENTVSRVLRGNPSGGIFSTAGDLLRFDQALRAHKLLGAEMTQAAMTPKPEVNSPFYGYGFFASTEQDVGRVAGHGGDGSGVNCQFKMYLDKGYTVAILSNYGAPSANAVERMIRELIARTK